MQKLLSLIVVLGVGGTAFAGGAKIETTPEQAAAVYLQCSKREVSTLQYDNVFQQTANAQLAYLKSFVYSDSSAFCQKFRMLIFQ
jgi:hypothetical protein